MSRAHLGLTDPDDPGAPPRLAPTVRLAPFTHLARLADGVVTFGRLTPVVTTEGPSTTAR